MLTYHQPSVRPLPALIFPSEACLHWQGSPIQGQIDRFSAIEKSRYAHKS